MYFRFLSFVHKPVYETFPKARTRIQSGNTFLFEKAGCYAAFRMSYDAANVKQHFPSVAPLEDIENRRPRVLTIVAYSPVEGHLFTGEDKKMFTNNVPVPLYGVLEVSGLFPWLGGRKGRLTCVGNTRGNKNVRQRNNKRLAQLAIIQTCKIYGLSTTAQLPSRDNYLHRSFNST